MPTIDRRIVAAVCVFAVALAVSAAARLAHEPEEDGAPAATASADAAGAGASGLPLPRFVSLKNTRVNVRRGPSQGHAIAWQFQRAGLPVEIIREFENWRLIRDSEGEEGWVFHSLLSGARTAIVAPWDHQATLRAMHRRPDPDAGVTARVEPQVVVSVKQCDGTWCAVEAKGYSGWIEQSELWGVYLDERITG